LVNYHHDKDFNLDSEALIDLYETFERVVSNKRAKITMDKQLEKFKRAKWLFGMSMANRH